MILGGQYLAKALEERNRRRKALVESYRRAYGTDPETEQVSTALGYGIPLIVAVVVVAMELYLVVILVSSALTQPPGTERNIQIVVAVLVPELVAALRIMKPDPVVSPSVASLLASN